MWGELAQAFQKGNGFIIAMLVITAFSLMVIIERFLVLQFVYNMDFKKFLNNLKKMVLADDIPRAQNLCKSVSRVSIPNISLRALEALETDPTRVRGVLEEETIDFLPKVERRLNAVPAFATLIMLIGILGTIDSLWGAFHSIDVLDTAKKQASLAQGIANSLNPAAFGILVCMVLLASHYFLRGLALGLTEKIHYSVAVLHNLMVPTEVAYMPVGGVAKHDSGGESQSQFTEEAPVAAAAAPEGAKSEENFDDTILEDIKDEEEII